MATATYVVCDACKAEGTSAGVGRGDIVEVKVNVTVTGVIGDCWWHRDLCSECRNKLLIALRFMGQEST